MVKRVFIIHGWGGNPKGDWFLWLKKELEKRNFEVYIPEMPNTNNPKINQWVNFIEAQVKKVDEDTYFIGHSIGCQAIMRYLEKLPSENKIGGAVFVAGWFNLSDETWDEDYTHEVADPWIETPIDFKKIKNHTKKFTLIQSDNDPYVLLSNAEIFKEKLEAKVFFEHNKGHISGEDGVKQIPIVLKELLNIAK